jgi:purine nucleoside phosphorylase
MIGIIGGTEVYEKLRCICSKKILKSVTPYGTCEYIKGKINNSEIIFISRHGKSKYPPHKPIFRINENRIFRYVKINSL